MLVVSHDYECLPKFVAELEEQFVQFLLVLGVETSRRLVGEYH